MIKKCKLCGKEFKTFLAKIKIGKGKYCSRKCCQIASIGRKGYWTGKKRKFSPEWLKNIDIANKVRSGEKNHFWKGGVMINKYGYIFVYKPNHPFCSSSGYIREHRLIMEKHLGKFLEPDEIVHHINKIPYDNRIENLKLMSKKEHNSLHNKGNQNAKKKIY